MAAYKSSQCAWINSLEPTSIHKLIGSLDPVKSVSIITPDACEIPDTSESMTKSGTLKDIVSILPEAAFYIPRNETLDSFLLVDGKIWLYLSPESFASFGLDAKRFGDRYLAIYDLKTPGKRLDRFLWALDNTITDTYEFTVLGPVQKCRPKNAVLDVLVPYLKPTDDENESFQDWANNLIEWVGLVFFTPRLLARDNGGIDPAICDYRQFEEGTQSTVSATSISKPIRSADVMRIWERIQASQRWSILHVQGFECAPITWKPDKPHDSGREVGYMLVKNGTTVTCFKYT